MKTDYIDISGITTQSNLPECPYNYPYKEMCNTFKLCIPNSKSAIETILELLIDTSIDKYNILNTNAENKLVIYGTIHFKILYIPNESSQTVYSAHFDIPFCTFILCNNICRQIKDIKLFVEDALITQIDSRNFYVSLLTLVYPIVKKQDKHNSKNFNTKNFNYIKNNVHSNSELNSQTTTCPYNLNLNKYTEIQDSKNSTDSFMLKYDSEFDCFDQFEFDNYYDYDIEYNNECNGYDIDINIDNNNESSFNNIDEDKIKHSNNVENIIQNNIDSNIEYDIQYHINQDTEYDIEIDMNTDMNSPKTINLNNMQY
ncbi:DUF3794 domain-containing protein [Oceanirhabdus sp. W0125-5]|uniref:DUF3794 domain-containing protein n=1 Tax=Oceanirhabdus sp. W0125-5 TaxID=2999116 RepID=UPI0022F313AC|nr:DUF3794 domain-containing protein [Oceanirhabdus sp. W0125-5]WBW96644.1 DUF3794 domain-containing protein [Oceanirhabdus sp. W0125-5]